MFASVWSFIPRVDKKAETYEPHERPQTYDAQSHKRPQSYDMHSHNVHNILHNSH